MSLANPFAELVQAIESYGRATKIPAQIRAVIDRHDMAIIDRSDGDSSEIDIAVRRGPEQIIVHFLAYTPGLDGVTHVAYDMDWHCGAVEPGLPEIERRSWNWDIPADTAVSDDEPSLFSILQ